MRRSFLQRFRPKRRSLVQNSSQDNDVQCELHKPPADFRALPPEHHLVDQSKYESESRFEVPTAIRRISLPTPIDESVPEIKQNKNAQEQLSLYRSLHKALEHADVSQTRLLLDSCPDPNYELEGRRVLHLAVFSPEITKTLLDRGADVNAPDSTGCLPLHRAAQTRSNDRITQSAELLITAGSYLEHRNDRHRTPLMEASSAHNVGVMRALILAGADARTTDDCGLAPLHLCCDSKADKHAQHEAVRLLVTLPWVDVDDVDSRGRSPLFLAAVHLRSQLVCTLLDVGADAECVDLERLRHGHLLGIKHRRSLYECEAVFQIRKAVGLTQSIYGGHGIPEGYERVIRLDDRDDDSMVQILSNGEIGRFVFTDVSLVNAIALYRDL